MSREFEISGGKVSKGSCGNNFFFDVSNFMDFAENAVEKVRSESSFV